MNFAQLGRIYTGWEEKQSDPNQSKVKFIDYVIGENFLLRTEFFLEKVMFSFRFFYRWRYLQFLLSISFLSLALLRFTCASAEMHKD